MTTAQFFKYWDLEADTIEFVSHACALYVDDSFMNLPAFDLVRRVQVYYIRCNEIIGMIKNNGHMNKIIKENWFASCYCVKYAV